MKAVLKGIRQGLITIALSLAIALIILFGFNQLQPVNAIPLVNKLVDYNLAQVNYTRTDLNDPAVEVDKTSSKHLIDNSRAQLKENTEGIHENLDANKLKLPITKTSVENVRREVNNSSKGEKDPIYNYDRTPSRVHR